MAEGDKDWFEVSTDKILGIKTDRARSVGFDVTGLVQLLSLPRQLRRDNCYNLRLIKILDFGWVKTIPVTKSYSDDRDLSWLTVANGNYGLDLTWKPPEKSTWMESFIRNTLTIAIGFIPGVGPLLAITFTVGWELLSQENPQAAYDLLKSLCPGLELGENVMKSLVQDAKDTHDWMPDGWDKMGLIFNNLEARSDQLQPRPIEEDMDRKLPMMLQGEVLASSGKPIENPKAEDDTPGEVIKDNAADDSAADNSAADNSAAVNSAADTAMLRQQMGYRR